jgi:membrane protease subunit HflK
MPWQNQGGSSGGGQGPWGRGPTGQRPPDIEDMLRRGQERLKRALPGGFGTGRGLVLVAIAAILLWAVSGFYRVQPDEQGVALIFGKWVQTTMPGLRYNLPAPIGHVETPKVTRVNRVEVGFRSGVDSAGNRRDVVEESLMLTGDENIIDIQFVVFWVIKDAGLFLFNLRDPDGTVTNVAESVMREIVGRTEFERARTQGRTEIEARALELIQSVLDAYGSGIEVKQVELQKVDPPEAVIEAFRDVQASRADKERAVNEAQAYFNEITERAKGEAQKIIKGAEGYKAEKIAIAQGDAQRFVLVYDQYVKEKDVTRRRLYLETMEKLMKGMKKVLIEDKTGAVPYLPLDEFVRRPAAGEVATGATP